MHADRHGSGRSGGGSARLVARAPVEPLLERRAGERGVREQQQVGELVVDPRAAERAEENDLRGSGRKGGLQLDNKARALLGYEKVNLIGGSYGSRAALIYQHATSERDHAVGRVDLNRGARIRGLGGGGLGSGIVRRDGADGREGPGAVVPTVEAVCVPPAISRSSRCPGAT